MDFPKICTRAPFGPSAYLKQISEYFPAYNSISDYKSSRQRSQTLCSSSTVQHPRSNCNAQPSKPLGVSRTRVNKPTCTTPPGTLAMVRGMPLSESERHASTKYYLKRSPRLFTRIEHTQHTTHHKTKTTAQHTDNSQLNYSTTSRWKRTTRFLLPRRALWSESWGSDIVRRALALLLSRPEAVIFR